MNQRSIIAILAVSAATMLVGCASMAQSMFDLPDYTADYERHENTMVAMKDGVKLNTDIYFPEGEGPFPVVVIRNPYNSMNFFRYIGKVMTRYGYVVVHQDTRGRFKSEGQWLPLANERADGLALLDWVIDQDWQDGNIGLFGPSYLGAVQWVIADQLPPEVKTMAVQVIGSNLASLLYQNGAFRHELFTFWASFMPDESIALFNGTPYRRMLTHRPHIEADKQWLGVELPWYRDWLRSMDDRGPIWDIPDARKLTTLPEKVNVPVLSLGGWYDLFTAQQLEDFGRLNTADKSRLIVGPWTHLMGSAGDGVVAFEDTEIAMVAEKLVNWFDHHLKGAQLDDWGPVLTYGIHDGWAARDQWPPKVESKKLYFDQVRRSDQCSGGVLGHRKPFRAQDISYIYNPDDPVPTRGGNAMLAFIMPHYSTFEPSNRDQYGLCKRDDVITFISAPLAEDMHIVGPPQVELFASTTAGDTAFTAKLIEIDDFGRAVNVSDSITTLRYPQGATRPIAYEPGTVRKLNFDLWPVEWVFKAGTRIRVDVSSSNFPAYNAHPNTEAPWYLAREAYRARQTIFGGGDHPSSISLPIDADASRTPLEP